jgi:hypothetical protein
VCAIDEQAAEITVPSFANSSEAGFASGRALSRHQPEPGGKLSAATEYVRICNRCCYRRGDDRPNPRNGGQTLANRVALVPRENLRLDTRDPCLGIFDLVDDYL